MNSNSIIAALGRVRHCSCVAAVMIAVAAIACAASAEQQATDPEQTSEPPAPPLNLQASDVAFDDGKQVNLWWDLSPDDQPPGEGAVDAYRIYRSRTAEEIENEIDETKSNEVAFAKTEATLDLLRPYLIEQGHVSEETEPEEIGLDDWTGSWLKLPADLREQIRQARAAAAEGAEAEFEANLPQLREELEWLPLTAVPAGTSEFLVRDLERDKEYRFRVTALNSDQVESAPAAVDTAVVPFREFFDGGRFYLLLITIIFCGAVIFWIWHARAGRPIRVRKIAGLEAVDEAVGRATEMGRPVLYVPGIQDMNEVQTIAGITILSRVARTAAEYDARVEVPTARSLVMTTARETVQAAYLSAGRPDAYNQDLIYYVTDEQFGYVAYLSGLMVREKPAACFYMGMFYAESLILAETGNSIGAIQVAGTAQPAQLPFFVAACDYTLIGEEFFAASAYLSGSAEELGSLKGQDVGKVIVGVVLIIGVILATYATVTESPAISSIVSYLKEVILT